MEETANEELANMPSDVVTDVEDIPDQTPEPDFGD